MIYENIVKDKSKTAVILCTFVRHENLKRTINDLETQTDQDFDLFICDNSGNTPRATKILASADRTINISAEDTHNEFKQFVRFVKARELKSLGYEIIIFIDDDEILPNNFIEECHKQYDPQCVKSFWAHKVNDFYWVKVKLEKGDTGNYSGTGGLVCSIDLFDNDIIFDCPEEYWIIDDLWLSFVITRYTDLKIMLLDVDIKFVKDDKATFLGLKELKENFTKEFILSKRLRGK